VCGTPRLGGGGAPTSTPRSGDERRVALHSLLNTPLRSEVFARAVLDPLWPGRIAGGVALESIDRFLEGGWR
jgi:hypothetical protein